MFVGAVIPLGVCGELEEHLLESGAVGCAQLDERRAGLEGQLTDDGGVGIDPQGAAPLKAVACVVVDTGDSERRAEQGHLGGAGDEVPAR